MQSRLNLFADRQAPGLLTSVSLQSSAQVHAAQNVLAQAESAYVRQSTQHKAFHIHLADMSAAC